jgi:molybdate-binding protein
MESYDLAIPEDVWQTLTVRAMVDILSDKDFLTEIQSLGGYLTDKTGSVVWLG